MRTAFKSSSYPSTAILTLVACGGGSSGGGSSPGQTVVGPQTGSSLISPACGGTRIWDFGASDEIQNSISLVSESSGFGNPDSRFPCVVIWEFVPDAGCSLLFTVEGFAATFNFDPSIFSEIGISGDNLIVRGSNGLEDTGVPANISVAELSGLPDCVLQ